MAARFSCIYSVRGAGGYQMFGITPMPIYDPEQEVTYLKDFMVFFKPGDIVKWKPIERVRNTTRPSPMSRPADIHAENEAMSSSRWKSLQCATSTATNAQLQEALYAR